MFPRALPIFAALALSSLAACNRATPTADAALQRDLEAARSQAAQASANMNIAPDEVIPAGNRSRARAQLPRVERVRHSPAPSPAPAPRVASAAPTAAHDSAIASAPATPRPSAQGAISAPPPGGYKTMGELIRKAPFPINP
jgi:hypothetical protein